MISKKLLITNNHLIPSVDSAMNLVAEFNYELDSKNLPKPVTRFSFAPHDFFISSHFDDLDFSIVSIKERTSGTSKLSKFGYIPLVNNQTTSVDGKGIIIHHPAGRYKRITLLYNTIIAKTEEVLHYYGNTQSGSSGAPVLNSNFELVALHHNATSSRPALDKYGSVGPANANEGIRICAIIKRINEEKHTLPSKQQKLINAALKTTLSQPNLTENESDLF